MLKYFTHCFVSERMGMEKPAREFFEGCFAALPGYFAGRDHDHRRFPDGGHRRWTEDGHENLLV